MSNLASVSGRREYLPASSASTRLARAHALSTYFEFPKLHHRAEILRNLRGMRSFVRLSARPPPPLGSAIGRSFPSVRGYIGPRTQEPTEGRPP